MSDAAARCVVVALVGAAVALELGAVLVTVGVGPLGQLVCYAVGVSVQAVAGAVIVWRYPRHRIGWLLVVFAMGNALFADAASGYGGRGTVEGWPGSSQAELVNLSSWIVACLGLNLLFLLFPDGTYLSPRWRWVPAVWLLGAVLAVPGNVLDPRLGTQLSGGANPWATTGLPVRPMYTVGAVLVCASLVASVAALVVRFRTSRRAVERRQLKWVMLAGSVLAVVLPLSAALWTAWPPIRYAAALALMLLPVAVCVAIVREHLYDIDLLVSRTLAYVVLTGALALTYAAVVVAVAALVASPVAAAAGALVVAVAFRPLRNRIQEAVDRRFRRARHEARSVVSDFVDRLRRGDAEADAVEAALRAAVHDAKLALRFRPAGGTTYDVHGRARALDAEAGRRITTVDTGEQVTTMIRHRETDRAIVAEVVDAGRLALEVAALQVELRRRLDELDASRARIVAVAEEERRRLARDLHDGAQQRLVAVGLGLRHAQHALDGTAPPEVDRTLDRAVAELGNAIDELRELATGLRPTSLDDGLGPALRDLAGRSPLPVEVHDVPDRFPGELEAAAYFIACEGLTNAVKHASARRVVLGVARRHDQLVLTVSDDGIGGADARRGTGVLGLVDRARAHGGTLTIDSAPGTGTRLTATLPCA